MKTDGRKGTLKQKMYQNPQYMKKVPMFPSFIIDGDLKKSN